MNRVEQHLPEYRAIFSRRDPISPTVDFLQWLREDPPSYEEMTQASTQDEQMLRAIAVVRYASDRIPPNGSVPIFRGSGIVAAGNADGLIAVHYQPDGYTEGFDGTATGDPVARHHGSYLHAALGKVAKGGLALRLYRRSGGVTTDSIYPELNGILVEHSLEVPEIPHHLGYAFHDEAELVAGASGMLPSRHHAQEMERLHRLVIEQDIERGWVKWPGDYCAGYWDKIAADSVLATYNSDHVIMFIGQIAHGQNVH